MANQTSRRSFLGMSAMGFVAAVTPDAMRPMSASTGTTNKMIPPRPEISVRVTAGDQRYAIAPAMIWRAAAEESTSDHVDLNPSQKFQTILGFGGAFTDGTCYTFNRLTPAEREKLFHELFHPSEMGLSTGRICVGSSDYSTKVYSFDEGEPDPDMKRFSIDHDREYILPMLRQARQVNPDLFLLSSPWSPPGWMKFNGTMLGGAMRKHYFPAYALYYQKFLQAYAAEGVPVQALTTQNEVDTDQDGRMPACIWPQEYEIEFVRDHLGPLLESSGVPAKMWMLDHNYNLWGRAMCSLEDVKLRKYSNAIAWHGYVGTPEMMSKVHDAYPEAEMHWTEGGPDYKDPNYLTDWCKWGATFSEILRNWCRSVTSWNLALDEQGRPNIGPFPCGGVVSIHSQTREITRSGQYWALAHYSRAIRRGACRFDSQSKIAGLHHVAFENTDGQQAVALTNPGPAKTIEVRLAGLAASIPLPANSLTTLSWK